jgi:hypothetical protein
LKKGTTGIVSGTKNEQFPVLRTNGREG